jgi:hypothetical protein
MPALTLTPSPGEREQAATVSGVRKSVQPSCRVSAKAAGNGGWNLIREDFLRGGPDGFHQFAGF